MKVKILNEYFDKGLNRLVKVGDVLEIDEDRYNVLKSVGVNVEEYIDENDEDENDEDENDEDENPTLDNDSGDEDSHGYSETDRQLELIGAYEDDKSIVDDLKADDLKMLCEQFEVNYTNVVEAKEALKILTIG